LLTDALREGRSVVLEEGIDLTFERVPPRFAHLEGQRITGRVELNRLHPPQPPRRPVPNWDAELSAVTAEERPSIRMLLQPASEPLEGWDTSLVGRLGGLTATASFRKRDGRGELNWNFNHHREDSPVRDQLAALRFIDALARGARLEVVDRGPAKTRRPPLTIDGLTVPEDAATRPLLVLLEDLRVIELWSGLEFTLPEELTVGEARDIAQIAALVRDCGRPITWADALMRTSEEAVDRMRAGGPIRVEQTAGATILGQPIKLGIVQTDIYAYEVASATPAPDDPGMVDVRIVPTDGDSAEIFERLLPTRRSKPRPPMPPSNRKKRKHGRNR
jgi:hypothetical protein